MDREEKDLSIKVERHTEEEQIATALLDLTKYTAVCVNTLYYYNIHMLKTKEHQSKKLLPTRSSLQLKLAGRRSETMEYRKTCLEFV